MVKQGVCHDYDLMANREEATHNQVCVVCDADPMSFQWSDQNGQAMCMRCGTPYQIANGTDEQIEKGEYPYLSLLPEWIPVVKKYYQETKRFTYLGAKFGEKPGWGEFIDWLKLQGITICNATK